MRIILITQSDPFYLGINIDYLLNRLPNDVTVVAAVIGDVSPFGKKESFIKKAINTLKIFGIRFFLHYSVRYILAKFKPKTSVESVCRRNGVDVVKLSRSINAPESLTALKEYQPDLLISISGNEIFKSALIKLAPLGCLNLHTAALPKYRGLMPSFWVLKNGESQTGVSVFFVDEGIDSGPILVQRIIEIEGLSQADLISMSKSVGMECLVEAVEKIKSGKFNLIPNDDEQMTYFGFPTAADVRDFRRAGAKFY